MSAEKDKKPQEETPAPERRGDPPPEKPDVPVEDEESGDGPGEGTGK